MLFELGATAVVVSEGPSPKLRTCLPDDGTLDAKLARLRQYLVALRSLGVDHDPSAIVARPFRDEGWALRWREFFQPLRIGRRLMVKPSWDVSPVKRADLLISLDPGMAFGTGLHPTTRLCLGALEAAADRGLVANARVLDVGCGSGILSVAAVRLGAREALGLDVDPIAVEATAANAHRNRVARRVRSRLGSLPSGQPPHDIVLANLIASLLVALAPALAAELRPDGVLIASGIHVDREAEVAAALVGVGLAVRERWDEGDWVAMEAARGA